MHNEPHRGLALKPISALKGLKLVWFHKCFRAAVQFFFPLLLAPVEMVRQLDEQRWQGWAGGHEAGRRPQHLLRQREHENNHPLRPCYSNTISLHDSPHKFIFKLQEEFIQCLAEIFSLMLTSLFASNRISPWEQESHVLPKLLDNVGVWFYRKACKTLLPESSC